MSPYEVLGVSPDSSDDEITARWKQLALVNHPDMHPQATSEQRRVFESRMASINAAYDDLMDPIRRAKLTNDPGASTNREGESTTSRHTGRHGRANSRHQRTPLGCDICGASPTSSLTYKQVTGQVFRDLVRTIDARLCRDCGLAIGREVQSKTILTGWWGLFAIFRNIAAIVSNSNSLYKASLTGQPQNDSGFFMPLPVGKSVFSRPRTWIGIGAVALAIAIGVSQSNTSSQSNSTSRFEQGATNQSASTSDATFRVGGCVSGFTVVSPVSCSSSHLGKIVAKTSYSFECPTIAESYVDYLGSTFCIDEDQ